MADQKEQTYTRYLVLRSTDEGKTAEILGHADAQSSEQALRKWFADPPRDEDTGAWYAAVSENSLKWRQVAATVKTTIREAQSTPDATHETQSLKV